MDTLKTGPAYAQMLFPGRIDVGICELYQNAPVRHGKAVRFQQIFFEIYPRAPLGAMVERSIFLSSRRPVRVLGVGSFGRAAEHRRNVTAVAQTNNPHRWRMVGFLPRCCLQTLSTNAV